MPLAVLSVNSRSRMVARSSRTWLGVAHSGWGGWSMTAASVAKARLRCMSDTACSPRCQAAAMGQKRGTLCSEGIGAADAVRERVPCSAMESSEKGMPEFHLLQCNIQLSMGPVHLCCTPLWWAGLPLLAIIGWQMP